MAEGRDEVVIVVDDMTRPTRAYQILPCLLQELKSAGISDDHLRFIMGGGLHGAWYRDDFAKKIGEELVERYPVYNHNPFSNCERVGETEKGTPVEINAEYFSCDLRIGIGCVVPHPMTGFGGGAKMILPGISSYESVYHNHANVHKENPESNDRRSYWGFLNGNKTRKDIDDAGRIAGMDIKIDVLVNGSGDSSQIFAGDLKEEFSTAVEKAKRHYLTPDLPEDIDVIIANTYAKANEAGLALSNWSHRMKKKGVMVIIAQAPEGQTTHYLYGKFGKNQFAPGCGPPRKVGFKKLIIFSEYKTPDPLLPVSDKEKMVWIDNWDEVIEEIESSFNYRPRVNLLPNSEIQCDKQTLLR